MRRTCPSVAAPSLVSQLYTALEASGIPAPSTRTARAYYLLYDASLGFGILGGRLGDWDEDSAHSMAGSDREHGEGRRDSLTTRCAS